MTETKLKAVNIEATFPELKGRFSTPTGRGHATNVRAARANAMRDLLKQVKGKKFRSATATISFWNYHSGVAQKKGPKAVEDSGALCSRTYLSLAVA